MNTMVENVVGIFYRRVDGTRGLGVRTRAPEWKAVSHAHSEVSTDKEVGLGGEAIVSVERPPKHAQAIESSGGFVIERIGQNVKGVNRRRVLTGFGADFTSCPPKIS